ncbi:MAG: Hsp33 family molecular chaperone HslO [Alphaproteobacteria bacterium]|nr:Hsp33 family molecular chaperone HslO [Alphaproteobacteria bacterium]
MDIIKPFMLEDGLFRGSFISADDAISKMMENHNYPPVVQSYLTQVALLAIALSAGIKYNGVFSLQIKGNGPISTLFCDITTDYKIRGYAVYDKERLTGELSNMNDAIGHGQMLFSVAQIGQEPYQGVVALTGNSLTDTVKEYFKLSEQIATDIVLRQNKNEARLIILQQMPDKQGISAEEKADLWETVSILLNSVKDIELFSEKLTPDEILFRLFHANGITVFPDNIPSYECRCYRDKMFGFLKKLSSSEREELYQDGKITTGCQFCNEQYIFTREDFE